ncbi:ChbG/HpnK family deacetylase [Ramlibacter agri]|uniref:ChbG/HpnK family deacetylase n=1 Tax=Ramlibacter agri TaxID=2728837 RepID=UPI003CC9603F
MLVTNQDGPSIVVCADHFGTDPAINAAALDLARMGRVSAISCMVGAPSWRGPLWLKRGRSALAGAQPLPFPGGLPRMRISLICNPATSRRDALLPPHRRQAPLLANTGRDLGLPHRVRPDCLRRRRGWQFRGSCRVRLRAECRRRPGPTNLS